MMANERREMSITGGQKTEDDGAGTQVIYSRSVIRQGIGEATKGNRKK